MKFVASLIIGICLTLCSKAYAQPEFPALTGRVVDNANLLSAQSRSALTQLLAEHEQETSNQVVVAVLADLDGYDDSDYGNRLFRHWQLGQKDKDNGVLLLVAIAERKIRIEVGYGLEGALTDALSSQIIRNEMTPAFKQSDYDRGVNQGINAILSAIAGEYVLEEDSSNADDSVIGQVIPFIMFGSVGGQIFLGRLFGRKKKHDTKAKLITALGIGSIVGIVGGIVLTSVMLGLLAAIGSAVLSYFFLGNSSNGGRARGRRHDGGFGGGGFGGSSGGGFSGGGGSSGGGGASGGW